MRYVFLRYPQGKSKAVTFSYDDGCEQDKRLAEMFDRYGLKGTFNFNSAALRARQNYSSEEIQSVFLSKGHEIAVHGAFHRANGKQRTIEGIRDVLDCRIDLEERCGTIIRGMAYPDSGITAMHNFATYEKIKQYLTDLDIAYSRTLAGDNNDFRLPEDFHAWMPSAHHDNPKIMEYIKEFVNLQIPEIITEKYPRLLYIWGHSFEFDRNNNWDHMEEICKTLSDREDIWYATNIEICDYVQAYQRLVYSANGKMVFNPTIYSVWFVVDGTQYCVHPGETVHIAE